MKSLPYITKDYVSFGDIIPIYSAIAFAVIKLSPVTILTVIPATLHFRMAYGTSGLGISLTPIIVKRTNPCFSTSNTPLLSELLKSSESVTYLKAKHNVLNDRFAILIIEFFISSNIFWSRP